MDYLMIWNSRGEINFAKERLRGSAWNGRNMGRKILSWNVIRHLPQLRGSLFYDNIISSWVSQILTHNFQDTLNTYQFQLPFEINLEIFTNNDYCVKLKSLKILGELKIQNSKHRNYWSCYNQLKNFVMFNSY